MADVDIDNLASIGVIQDEPGYQIPPEGWTLGQNIRYIANGLEQMPGWSPTLGNNNPRATQPPPGTPVLSTSAGGTLAATTYYVRLTYTTASGESLPSIESSIAVAANQLLNVAHPTTTALATGWNVYASNTAMGGSGAEVLQTSLPSTFNWVEPTTGMVTGAAAPPTVSTITDAPMFLMYVSGATQPWWLWASLTKIYVFDGTNDNDITRQTAGADVNYNATDAKSWNGTIFQGVPILNSGSDIPQFWATYNPGTKMQNQTAWPAGMTSRVVRSFLAYMFALNNTTGGVNLPHQVRWSNAAVPGNLPSTWDYTDPTNDAGSTDLPDVYSGRILDGQELQGQFFIYKETSTWRVQFVGSPFVFSFHTFLETAGILATRCFAMTGDGLRHVVVTQDDIIVHNGVSAESLLSKRFRRYLFNRIEPTTYDTSFMFSNPVYDEVWFAYPSIGQSEPDSALVWNYRYNTFSEVTGVDFRATEIGTIPVTGTTWAQQTLQWNQDTAQWATSKRRRVVLVNPNTKKFLLLDDTSTTMRDGLPFYGTAQRTGLSILGRKRDGNWDVDFKHKKMVRILWPKAQAASPGIQVRVGYAQTVNGSVTWNPYVQFDPNTQVFAEGCEGEGRSVAVEFRNQNGFRLDGYKLDIAPTGEF